MTSCSTLVRRHLLGAGLSASLAVIAVPGHASIVFSFTETGGTVVMTSSGVLDTTQLVSVSRFGGWGGTGTENNSIPGDIDIMGGTDVGGVIDTHFGFHAGTDASAITNPGGPFAFSDFSVASISGSNAFVTYSGFQGGFRVPGIGVFSGDIVGGLWTPDQVWTYAPGATFTSLGLNVGDYVVTDAVTGESLEIRIVAQSVPEPSTLALLSAGLIGLGVLRRRKANA